MYTDQEATDTPFVLPVPPGATISTQVSQQAVNWLVTLQAGHVSEPVRAQWLDWRAAHVDHERAWQHIEQMCGQLRAINSPVAHGTLANQTAVSRRRRQTLACMALICSGAGAWLLLDTAPARVLLADYRTATGQIEQITLADGTRVVMNTGTAINVTFDSEQRAITLLAGEILIDTAKDPLFAGKGVARPFLVHTAQGRLRALGTRFSVRQQDTHSQLHVYEGAVEIRPTEAYGSPVVIAAGGQTSFTSDAVAALQTVDAGSATWVQEMLVAHDMSLAAFLAELSRYRTGRLQCDDAVAMLRVSGIYPVTDTDKVLDMLQRTLPVELHRFTRYWVTLRQAPGSSGSLQ